MADGVADSKVDEGDQVIARRNIVLCDLDHTISDARWRDDLIKANDWDAYHAGFKDDAPCTDIIGLVNSLAICGYKIYGITARPVKWKKATQDWLIKHGVMMHELLMRPDTDYQHACALKMALAGHLLDRVAFILDDREDVCASFKGIGITALAVQGRCYR